MWTGILPGKIDHTREGPQILPRSHIKQESPNMEIDEGRRVLSIAFTTITTNMKNPMKLLAQQMTHLSHCLFSQQDDLNLSRNSHMKPTVETEAFALFVARLVLEIQDKWRSFAQTQAGDQSFLMMVQFTCTAQPVRLNMSVAMGTITGEMATTGNQNTDLRARVVAVVRIKMNEKPWLHHL